MSFIPVSGPARFLPAERPKDSSIEFNDDRRSIVLPLRGALPVLAKARDNNDAHPSVQLLAGTALLGLQLVAAGKFAPDETGTKWQVAGLEAKDEQRILDLATARTHQDFDSATAEGYVRAMLEALADLLPRTAPSAGPQKRPAGTPDDFSEQLKERLDRIRARGGAEGPNLVSLSLRLEADEEELAIGSVRLVLQVHSLDNPAHVTDAALLWTEAGPQASHGFGERARTHASIALRSAAAAWPVLDRLLDLRIPDEITLDPDELLSLIDEGTAALEQAGCPVMWPRYLNREVTQRVELGELNRREEPLQEGLFGANAVFGFSWQLALHGDPLSEDEMERLAQSTAPVIRLRDNWVAVDSTILKRARKRLVRTLTPVQALATALTEVVELEDEQVEAVVGASLLAVRERLLNAATGAPIPVPLGLKASLRDYQRQGLTWLAELTGLGLGACLADDMGLGKTITLIALHLHRQESPPTSGPTLVVCPASLLGNWEAEIQRFAPGVAVRRHHGAARDLSGLRDGFVLTTYGTMRKDAAQLGEVDWSLVVADEAQHVKNSRAGAARALRTINGRARVALTGTPVENDLTELWSILDWATPGLLGSRAAFRKTWAAPIEAGVDPALTRRFADLIGPFLLRRRKSDPGIAPELPAKTETDHLLGLTREQVVLYETYVRESMRRIEQADPMARRGLVLMMLTGLKQICNHPAHFLKQARPRLQGRSEKLDLLDELLGTVLAEDGAVLVFTQYVAMARLIEQHLDSAGIPSQFLHGATPVRQREAMVARFQDDQAIPGSTAPVFLLSLKAGGTGLNLTRADHVIHFDRWWNPAVEDQATDRAYRIGQTRPVQVHRFVTQGTIEEKIAQLLSHKRGIADSVLANGEAALTELSNDELRDFVELRQ